jgi:medium-chain acyl-[acyl-carrier-protein] hydrolase
MSEQAPTYSGRPASPFADSGYVHSPFAVEYRIRGFECGYGGPLRVLPLLNLIQEAAGGHADRLGWGVDDLQAVGRTWMLSRVDIRVERLPRAGDKVEVSTWPAGAERLFALRDFVMRSAEGEILVGAVYAYLIVDLAARRPLRPERVFGPEFPKGPDPHPVADFSFDIPETSVMENSFSLRACPRHLDNNGHVNNAYIADWLADAVPRPERASGVLRVLRVEFDAEALEGDELQARWARPDSSGEVGGFGSAAGPPSVAKRGVADSGDRAQAVTELRRGEDIVARALTVWT